APGDPASSPLNQREKHSAKIVFETSGFFFDVCLDRPTYGRAAPVKASKGQDSNLTSVVLSQPAARARPFIWRADLVWSAIEPFCGSALRPSRAPSC
ncbi:uncharacterized protein TRAVEDRAFT_120206, partial [Trametes versicolor FP-101664 SS1]|uniref:uncharacterized protein n=1 Tax=Trametes versicolor (strain FP-101664) TaxID=717944 RepID=UPI0004622297